MPETDSAAEQALDEAMGLCLDPVGRQAELVRWLGRHPELAAELAEDIAAAEQVDELMAPLRNDTLSNGDQTITYGGQTQPSRDSTALDFGGFELLGELGRGGMGVVYKARDKALNKIVALKTTRSGGFSSKREVSRLQYEMEAAARLDHPNIVPIYGAGENQGMPFFSMRLVEGGTLAEKLAEQRQDLRKAASILAKVARAVDYAHQRGIIHRDLKPANILLDRDEPMVADFGLAKVVEAQNRASDSGTIVGTVQYMAPEQARGDRGLTTAVDVYGLGAILYELLTGRPPFQGETVYETLQQVTDQQPREPSHLNPDAPPDLAAICMKCLEKKAENRWYSTAADLAEDLERFSQNKSVSVRPWSVATQFVRAIRSRRENIGPVGERWMSVTTRALVIASACHVAIFWLVVEGAKIGWVWGVLMIYFGFVGIQRSCQARRSRSHAMWERHTITLWAGQLICSIALAAAILPFDPNAPADRVLAWYPPLTVLFAMVLFVQGSITWGIYFLGSFLYIALALALRHVGTAAPLVFLVVHVPMMLILARGGTSTSASPTLCR